MTSKIKYLFTKNISVFLSLIFFYFFLASAAKNTAGSDNPNPLISQAKFEAALKAQKIIEMSHNFAAQGSSKAHSVKESFISFHHTLVEKLNSLIKVGNPMGDLLQSCKYGIILAIILVFVVILNLLFRELLLNYLNKKLSNEKLGLFGVYAKKYLNLFTKLIQFNLVILLSLAIIVLIMVISWLDFLVAIFSKKLI